MSDNKQQQNKPIQIVRISGSKADGQHVVQNIINTSPDTRFSSKGVGAYFDTEYNEPIETNTLNLILFRGNQRKTKFSIASTDDFKTFKPLQPSTFVSNGNEESGVYHFNNVTAKGFRISFEGNKANIPPNNNNVASPSGVATTTTAGYVDKTKPHPGNIGPLSGELEPITADNAGNSDIGPNSNFFSVIGASFVKQDLDDETKKTLDNQVKESQQADKDCKDCKCVRCNETTQGGGICPKCGIKGFYDHPSHSGIASVFPTKQQAIDTVTQVDTTPSATEPVNNPNINISPNSTVPAGAPSQAGNTVDAGINVETNIAQTHIGSNAKPLESEQIQKSAQQTDKNKTATTTVDGQTITNNAEADKKGIAQDNGLKLNTNNKDVIINPTKTDNATQDVKTTTTTETTVNKDSNKSVSIDDLSKNKKKTAK